MNYNINNMATVILTESGACKLNDHTYPNSYHEAGTTYTTELWYMMKIFGPFIHYGGVNQMFLNNNISIE